MGEGYRAADAEARAVTARTEAVRMRAETAKVKTMARTWVEAARTRAKVAGLENCRSLPSLLPYPHPMHLCTSVQAYRTACSPHAA